jgi:DNA repair protein RadC
MRYCRIRLLGSSREQLHAIYLDRALRPVAGKCLQTGTVDHVTVYPREILAMALRHGATAIVLAHNHPSGNPQPSRADIAMTKLVEEAALPFGIAIVDHIIVGNQGNFSFRQYGLLQTTA